MIVDSHHGHTTSNGKTLGRRRLAYSIAAGAAGAVAAGASTEANAAIIYSGVQNLPVLSGFTAFDLDLDASGSTPDIKLKNYIFSGVNYVAASVDVAPGQLVLSNSSFP